MRFAVDAHAIGRKLTGNETYIRSLLREFPALVPDAEIHAFICNQFAQQVIPASITTHQVSPNPFLRLGLQLGARAQQLDAALLHVQYTGPLHSRVPLVVSVHDVSFIEHPEFFSWARRSQLAVTVRRTVERAAVVICPSDFSRQRVLDVYDLPDSKVVTIHTAVSNHFRPIAKDVAKQHVRALLGFDGPFVLSVGDLRKRKNQPALIRAFSQVMAEHPALTHHLVLAGKPADPADAFKEAERSPFRPRIHFLNFVDDAALPHLYNACDVFAFPSWYEGFGLPVLEAMACGAPVICSNTTAIPEVADSAALLFNPHQDGHIALALRDLLLDAELRARMSRLGQQRAAKFRWDTAAARTLEVYYQVAGSPRSLRPAPAAAVSA